MSFYNTAPPTPSTKNNITDIAVSYGIRDFLLNKNLLPTYPFISTAINGSPRIGEPVLDTSINGNSNVIPFGLPLETEGLVRYNSAIASNQFKNDDPTSPSLLSIVNITQTQGVFGNVDFPSGIQSYPIGSTQQVAEYGLLGKTAYAEFRKKATLYNLYLDTTKQVDAADWITLQPAGFTQQLTGYLDQYGSLNLGGSKGIQAANIIGSVLNGQGLGLAKGGVVTNFDIRSSLAGRVLGATGAINDTKLGMIGGQQLALALANNAAFNLQQDILGSLNVQNNILALVKGGPLPGLRPNYQITVPSSNGGKIADYTEKVLGFTIPKSYLTPAGSIFSSENPAGNIQRANFMLENTGKGQRQSLTTNMFANINGTGDYDNPNPTPFRSGYAPGYAKGEEKPDLTPPNIYAFYDDKTKGTVLNLMVSLTGASNLIPTISYDRSNLIKEYGFEAPSDKTFIGHRYISSYDYRKVNDVGFSWGSRDGKTVNGDIDDNYEPLDGDKKSLLVKTQKLFNSKGMLNIVTRKGDMNKFSSQIETASGGGFSKGSGVLTKDVYAGNYQVSAKFDTAENTYCRSWTTIDRYDKVSNLIRNSGLTEFSSNEKIPYRFQYENSTLESAGFVKIAPYVDEYEVYNAVIEANPKNYMFSIENLAWNENTQNLLPVEQGPGDLTTGTKGRIMWFPPYDIQFSESTSVNWESTNFIGRGEPVYTYNNTERSGNLSFKIIVDHSSYVNAFGDSAIQADDNYVASFFAGCVDPDSKVGKRLTISQKSVGAQLSNETIPKKNVENPKTPVPFNVYFPNDIFDINTVIGLGYENGLNNNYNVTPPIVGTTPVTSPNGVGNGIGKLQGMVTPPKDSNGKPMINNPKTPYFDGYNFGKNAKKIKVIDGQQEYSGITDAGYFSDLSNYLENTCKACIINIQATASPQGYEPYNTELAKKRAQSVAEYIKQNLTITNKSRITAKLTYKALTKTGCIVTGKPDQETCKEDRRAEVTFDIDPNLLPKEIVEAPVVKKDASTERFNTEVTNQLYDESRYFNRIKQSDPLVFDAFRDKIKYFHPAFHSMTPEGLNSRLTFLQQCTRQGPTLETSNTKNLAFGRAPVCILRIGDFYHTKIVIDSLNVDYEPLVWDLNPEGIGVQPMIANVNLSFKFVGGSSLKGPINILQNALSFNYYANTHVYDPRASYLKKAETPRKDEKTGKDLGTYDIVSGSPISNYIKVPNQPAKTPQLEINQNAEADRIDANSDKPTSEPASGSTTPAVSGIGNISVGNWGGEKHDIRVNLTFDGLTSNSTEQVKNTFLNKGLKLSIENVLGQLIIEETVVLNSPNYKGLEWLLSGGLDSPFGFYFGSIIENDSSLPKIIIPSGSYVLKVKYDGGLLLKKMFIVT
jgi:hypothetical protein